MNAGTEAVGGPPVQLPDTDQRPVPGLAQDVEDTWANAAVPAISWRPRHTTAELSAGAKMRRRGRQVFEKCWLGGSCSRELFRRSFMIGLALLYERGLLPWKKEVRQPSYRD
jgi:hypothetical protein